MSSKKDKVSSKSWIWLPCCSYTITTILLLFEWVSIDSITNWLFCFTLILNHVFSWVLPFLGFRYWNTKKDTQFMASILIINSKLWRLLRVKSLLKKALQKSTFLDLKFPPKKEEKNVEQNEVICDSQRHLESLEEENVVGSIVIFALPWIHDVEYVLLVLLFHYFGI